MSKEVVLEKLKIRKSTPNWIEYAVFACVSLFLALGYQYFDFKSLTVWSTVFLDCLAEGRLDEYYSVAHQNLYGAAHQYVGFNYLAFLPWAVWNLPIWAMQRFGGLRIVDHTLMMLWSKMFLVALVFLIAYYSRKILLLFTEDSYICEWSMYLIICSPLVFLAVIVAGQTDIIVIAAAVIAVYYLLQDRKGIFLLCMAYSISAKPFLIFAYIAVIMLVEKNVIKLALMMVASVTPMLLFHLIYRNAPLYQESLAGGTGDSVIDKVIVNTVPALSGNVPVVFLLLTVFYFMAYCINYDSRSMDKKKYIIYMMLAPMIIYFTFGQYEFYRRVYLIPFMIIMMAVNRKFWSVNLLLEKVMTVVGTFLLLYGAYTAYAPLVNQNFMRRLGLVRDTDRCKYLNCTELLGGLLGENASMVMAMGQAVYVAVSLLFLFINLPFVSRKLPVPAIPCVRAVYWLNIVTVAAFSGVIFVCYFS